MKWYPTWAGLLIGLAVVGGLFFLLGTRPESDDKGKFEFLDPLLAKIPFLNRKVKAAETRQLGESDVTLEDGAKTS